VYGTVATGRYMTVSGASGDWAVGNTVTGGTSTETATIIAISSENDYFLVGAPSGAFTAGETITNGSTGTATLGNVDSSVYGHEFVAPQSSLPTFTVEIGKDNEAIRYTGVSFREIALSQTDNMMVAQVAVEARYAFKAARVTEAVTSGAGSKTINLDQTTGLVASDSIKVYRAGTGYLDFSAASTKTHTVGTVASETSITVTNLETSLAVGDLIVLAPLTTTYSVGNDFTWIGGSLMALDSTITTALSASGDCIEDFGISILNEMESKHCANGINHKDRFPAKKFLKGFDGTANATHTYTNPVFISQLRRSESFALYLKCTGEQIGSTAFNDMVDFRQPKAIFDAFNANLSEDALVMEEMPMKLYKSDTDGYTAKALLVNNKTSY
jgi:hypothetical protein